MQMNFNCMDIKASKCQLYEEPIHIYVQKSADSPSLNIAVRGENLSLQTFQGKYKNELAETFLDLGGHQNEFSDMKAIFGDSQARRYYGDGQAQNDEHIMDRINFNAKRAFEGNPFTGFAILENQTRKIIGFTALGRGFVNGVSQCALILNSNYQKQGYGLEAAILAGSLALYYADQKFEVGSKNEKKAVEQFTATCRDNNERGLDLIKRLGFSLIRPLLTKEKSSDETSSLYGIECSKIRSVLSQFVDTNQIIIHD